MATTIEVWEGRASADVGVLIHSYLLTHPAPAASELADNLQAGADALLEAGRKRLALYGTPRLAVVGGDA